MKERIIISWPRNSKESLDRIRLMKSQDLSSELHKLIIQVFLKSLQPEQNQINSSNLNPTLTLTQSQIDLRLLKKFQQWKISWKLKRFKETLSNNNNSLKSLLKKAHQKQFWSVEEPSPLALIKVNKSLEWFSPTLHVHNYFNLTRFNQSHH